MTGLARWIVLKVLYPLTMLLSAITPQSRERYQAMIISMNNALIRRSGLRSKKLLLLMPHCLQVTSCDIRITHNVRNCKRCGKCDMKNLIDVAERKAIELHVATGGNLARRIVKDVRPELIIAVACERDLSSGIADVFPMPVYGITNDRPSGPCVDTRVSIEKLEAAIDLLS